MVDEHFKSWLAGFIDGEGCFGIGKCRNYNYPRLNIVNTDVTPLIKIKENYGGNIGHRKRVKANWKRSYDYYLCNSSLKKLLDETRY